MKLGRREQKILIQALYQAAEWEQTYIDAYTPSFSFEKPTPEGRRVIRQSTKQIARYRALRQKILEEYRKG